MHFFEKINLKSILLKILTMSQQYTAFTLAEVLITLAVIGVIAAFTLSTLFNNIQNIQNRIAFKKMYSVIAQAVSNIAYNNGGSIENQFNNNDTFKDLFTPQMSVIKTCNSGDSTCWTCNGTRVSDFFLTNQNVAVPTGSWWYKDRPVIILKDGTFMNFASLSPSCKGSDSHTIDPYSGTMCGSIFVDVNGCKSPNTWGKDIFEIGIQKNKIFPYGPSNNDGSAYQCNSSVSQGGILCAEYVIESKDY